MLKHYFKILIFIVGLFEILNAKAIVDCRVVTGGFVTTCNPYGKKLHHIKEVTYDVDRKKLIIEKTLPKVEKKHHLKVISVAQMIEKYVKVERPVRFKGSDSKRSKIKIIPYSPNQKTDKQKSTEEKMHYADYTVVKGDSLSRIAQKLNLKVKQITKLNGIKKYTTLRIGEKLKVPYTQKMVNALSHASYTVESGDTLLSIAKMFKLSAKDIVTFNHIKDATTVRPGKVLKLPLPYVLAKREAKQRKEDDKGLGNNLNINAFGTHKLRVTATAYTSHGNQTDSTPFLAAWNNHIHPGMKVIAVSRDLLSRFGMRNGTKVRIAGLRGYYRVRDKMNKRYRKRIDIYMGLDLRRALRWGRRSVVIYW